MQINGVGIDQAGLNNDLAANRRFPIWIVLGDQHEVVPAGDEKRFAVEQQSKGMPVEGTPLPGPPQSLEPEDNVIFRYIGEYCRTHLVGTNAWQDYHSIAQWQAETPSLGWFWLPATGWAMGWFFWKLKKKPAPMEKFKLQWHETALRRLAAVLASWALIETCCHLIPPDLPVSDRTLRLARRFSVPPKESADFEFLATQRIWHGQKLGTLLDHVELAGYNRQLVNWQLNDQVYRDDVLSPVIIGATGEQLNWRRPLWEEFYPRIRHESSPEEADKLVVRHLRERISVLGQSELPNPPRAIHEIWLRQITDHAGFETICVAALRSVGVPARLAPNGQAELYTGETWLPAPPPDNHGAF